MPQRWYQTRTFKISVFTVILAGVFGVVQAVLPLLFERSKHTQGSVIIHGGEGGKGVGAGGGAGVAIGTVGPIDMRGGEGGRIVVLDGTAGQAPGAGGGGPGMIVTSTNPVALTRSGTGGDGEDSTFAGIRAQGGEGGRGPLEGGGGGEVVLATNVHIAPGTYNVVVGRGGKGAKAMTGSNAIVGNGGDGSPGIVIIRYRKDSGTGEVSGSSAFNDLIKEANKMPDSK